jgi:hypothetical protein
MENNTKNVIISLETEPDSLSLTSELVFDEHLIFDEVIKHTYTFNVTSLYTLNETYANRNCWY